MHRLCIAALGLVAGCTVATLAWADEPKLPMKTDDGTIYYVAPKVTPTEKSADTLGATVGVQRPSGGTAYGGMDVSGSRPVYSVGGSTGGNTSFSAGVESDGKQNNGVKAGITIKY